MTSRIKPEKASKTVGVRLRSLRIENYKKIDELDIEFHGPKLAADPNVTVIGSANGLGKTSILECCALLLLSFSAGRELSDWPSLMKYLHYADISIDPFQLMVRAGKEFAKIQGEFSIADKTFSVSMTCGQGRILVDGDSTPRQLDMLFDLTKRGDPREQIFSLFLSLLGISGEPMIFPPFLYFNSFRKIQEGNPELGMMMSGERFGRRGLFDKEYSTPFSAFKIEIIRSLMGGKGLFDGVDEAEADAVVQQLNALIAEYANGTLAKLRGFDERAVELRIHQKDSKNTYPFDGLSSGQKEIISTLFLIWKYTRKQPGIVLIDEPELHLNAEWQRGLILQLAKLQPQNQYIVATHSEQIFDSADASNRLLLRASET